MSLARALRPAVLAAMLALAAGTASGIESDPLPVPQAGSRADAVRLYNDGVALLVAGLALYLQGPSMQVWSQIVLLPLLVAGIGLTHALVARRRVGGMLGLFYAALLLVSPAKYMVSGLAAVDAVADLRRRLGVAPLPPSKD